MTRSHLERQLARVIRKIRKGSCNRAEIIIFRDWRRLPWDSRLHPTGKAPVVEAVMANVKLNWFSEIDPETGKRLHLGCGDEMELRELNEFDCLGNSLQHVLNDLLAAEHSSQEIDTRNQNAGSYART